jgi:hypothetical protein
VNPNRKSLKAAKLAQDVKRAIAEVGLGPQRAGLTVSGAVRAQIMQDAQAQWAALTSRRDALVEQHKIVHWSETHCAHQAVGTCEACDVMKKKLVLSYGIEAKPASVAVSPTIQTAMPPSNLDESKIGYPVECPPEVLGTSNPCSQHHWHDDPSIPEIERRLAEMDLHSEESPCAT